MGKEDLPNKWNRYLEYVRLFNGRPGQLFGHLPMFLGRGMLCNISSLLDMPE
ncbi:hypothetical protein [Paenibacillus lautus]|uniref:hypothetical protein n=1 Tax=Paenibacillus lautus TaxID=1401 RepID=UPI001C7D5015|nr:hypothetical protein [Paenibacillus lautus]